jgi:hypothetical protein
VRAASTIVTASEIPSLETLCRNRNTAHVMLSVSEASQISRAAIGLRFFAGVYPESVEGAQNDVAARLLSEGIVPDGLIEQRQTSLVGLRLVPPFGKGRLGGIFGLQLLATSCFSARTRSIFLQFSFCQRGNCRFRGNDT